MRIYGLVQDSVVDGPGWRFVCFVQGCQHHCCGCHNPKSHDPEGGIEMPVEGVIFQMLSNRLTDGLTLSGGEPFNQPEDCLAIAKAAHENGLNVWCYTGFLLEDLISFGTKAQRALLDEIDVLVDGPFIEAQRSLALDWRGSSNQRVIDLSEIREKLNDRLQ